MRFNDLAATAVPVTPSMSDPASSAASAIEAKTGSHVAGLAGAALVGYLMKGIFGAAIGVGLAQFLKKKDPGAK